MHSATNYLTGKLGKKKQLKFRYCIFLESIIYYCVYLKNPINELFIKNKKSVLIIPILEIAILWKALYKM